MPDKGQRIVVLMSSGDHFAGDYDAETHDAVSDFGFVHLGLGQGTHWMPLPPPPKAEGTE